jgi:hypothetical protein
MKSFSPIAYIAFLMTVGYAAVHFLPAPKPVHHGIPQISQEEAARRYSKLSDVLKRQDDELRRIQRCMESPQCMVVELNQ